jgi:hypothetical protein
VLLGAGLLALVLGVMTVLAVAPRLRVFDDRRARIGFLVVLAVVAVAVPLVVARAVDRLADTREADAAEEVYAWLSDRPYDLAVAQGLAEPSGAPGVAEATLEGDELVLARPVVVAWQSRCVIGRLAPDGLASVKRSPAPCP